MDLFILSHCCMETLFCIPEHSNEPFSFLAFRKLIGMGGGMKAQIWSFSCYVKEELAGALTAFYVCFQVSVVMSSVSCDPLSRLFSEMEVGRSRASGSQMLLHWPWAFLLKKYVPGLDCEMPLELQTCSLKMQIFLSCAGIYKILPCLSWGMHDLQRWFPGQSCWVIWAARSCASWLIWVTSCRRKPAEAFQCCSSIPVRPGCVLYPPIHGHKLRISGTTVASCTQALCRALFWVIWSLRNGLARQAFCQVSKPICWAELESLWLVRIT